MPRWEMVASPQFSPNSLLHCIVVLHFSVPVVVRFTPKWEKEVNFNVTCNVKRKMLPLTLNVKAEGYSMNCLVLCEDSAGNKVQLSNTCRNQINFGRVSYCCLTYLLYLLTYLPCYGHFK